MKAPMQAVLRRLGRAGRPGAVTPPKIAKAALAWYEADGAELDLAWYRRRNADMRDVGDTDVIAHYWQFGRAEGRLGHSPLDDASIHARALDPARPTIILVQPDADGGHAASTGRDLVTELTQTCNVVAFLMSGGDALTDIQTAARATLVLPDAHAWGFGDTLVAIAQLCEHYQPRYVIANSALTYPLVPAFEAATVPTVTLVHEAEEDMRPRGVLTELFGASSQIVFADPRIEASMRLVYDELTVRSTHVITPPDGAGLTDYARRIDELGRGAKAGFAQEDADIATISASGAFNVALYADPGGTGEAADYLRRYVHRSRMADSRAAPGTGALVRRPMAGFNPLVYAEPCTEYDERRDGDPFADFLQRGRPDGEWMKAVVAPGGFDGRPLSGLRNHRDEGAQGSRVLVHGHFHYDDLVTEFLDRLALNTSAVDLRLSATTPDGVERLTTAITERDVANARVDLAPNRGRNLGPLLTGMPRDELLSYDLLLHVHSKRSPRLDATHGDVWRSFLWDNLVGGQSATMLDVTIAAFAADPGLGLVSPDDPNLFDWGANRAIGEQLAARLGITAPLPTHFDFPVGGMFWARPAALAPLLDLALTWDDYPAEPLPSDGTILHVIERIIPFVVQHQGFAYAKTWVPGVTR
jgi:hypothetical protein